MNRDQLKKLEKDLWSAADKLRANSDLKASEYSTPVLGLIFLSLAWELVLAPLRPGGSWLVLKALPLCIPLIGLLKHRMYTYRWLSLMVWVYFTEGAVRASSDRAPSNYLAMVEVVLCLALFVACALHVRLRLKSVQAVN